MIVLKCKICGGSLNIQEGQDICTCEYCGTRQTLPKLDNERKLNLYDRASHLRRSSDFDKASVIYEQILSEDKTDAEAYWSLVLCKYGVEYVEDPSTHKRIPTVNRTQFTSIFNDPDYKEAINHASIDQKVIYEEEAEKIDDIQKGILDISKKEEPYDIFICYKETDNNGRRTLDSVLAQDIYKELTKEGYKVFFSRITLEDKIGMAYEPYIFAALNSAKVMIVVGTSKDNFNAVWVKNEWSRYLSLMKKDDSKVLVPCYRDMDPYDLPEEFAYLQAQDMSKLGFMQDLVRGIDKITRRDKRTASTYQAPSTNVSSFSVNLDSLLKRANMFLEDGDFKSADEYFDRVLDINPECGDAYLGKFLTDRKVLKTDTILENYKDRFLPKTSSIKSIYLSDIKHIDSIVNKYNIPNYLNEEIIREKYRFDSSFPSYTDEMIKNKNELINEISNYNLLQKALKFGSKKTEKIISDINRFYDHSISESRIYDEEKEAKLKDEYISFLNKTDGIIENEYKSALARKESDYQSCVSEFHNLRTITQAKELKERLILLNGYKDSQNYISLCEKKINEFIELKEIAGRKRKRNIIVVFALLVTIVSFGFLYAKIIGPMIKYAKAISLYKNEEYSQAYALFDELGDYKNSNTYKYEIYMKERYNNATSLFKSGDYLGAYSIFGGLGDYNDSRIYKDEAFQNYINEFSNNCYVGGTFSFGFYEQDNDSMNGKEVVEWRILAIEDERMLLISKYALDRHPYNSTKTNSTWEDCSLRSWLNDSFYNDVFSNIETKQIFNSVIIANSNPDYSTDQGNDTNDRIFLLSIDEVNKYFSSDEDRQCKATDYAYSHGVYKNNENDNCFWWLRTSGISSACAAGVKYDGKIYSIGNIVNDSNAVRPALWIALDK